MKTLTVAHLAPHLKVHVALFEGLKNARFLRKQLLEGNTDFEYAFIDAKTVLAEAQVLAAVFRAVNDMSNDRMKSRNVHSEIVLALSPNNNIAESFRRFGISDQTRNLLVIKVASEDNATGIAQQLDWAVEAQELDFDDATLYRLCDVAEIRKIYKLPAPHKARGKTKQDEQLVVTRQMSDEAEAERNELQMAILGMIALRGAT